MTAVVVPIGLRSQPVPAAPPVEPVAGDTAIDHYADLLSALSLGPLSRPMIDPEGGLRFEWKHTDRQGRDWDLRAIIEACGGLYMVALGPDAVDDDELYLEHFDAAMLIRFVTGGAIPS